MTEQETKPDPEQLFGSLTGFEEIAVRRMFGTSATALAKSAETEFDVPMFLRALSFVLAKRAGAGDADAFTEVMRRTTADVMTAFDTSGAGAGPGGA